ncbi:hypothetical protein SLA2020_147080 [Shorea laevis]
MAKSENVVPSSTKHGNLLNMLNFDGKIAYEEIIKATENFDTRYCIGFGSYGSVYRVELPCGKVVTVKKLHCEEAEEPDFNKSFRNDAKMLLEIRHRNIVKLHGFCLHKKCMILVYAFMEVRNLFCFLKNDAKAVELDWAKRINIVKSIANELCYLHQDCIPPILHRDISSKNILLNSDMEVFVSDFGVARLLNPDSSNQAALVGYYG